MERTEKEQSTQKEQGMLGSRLRKNLEIPTNRKKLTYLVL